MKLFKLNDLTHQVRHICKAHKANSQKPTLQKSLPYANAQATLCGWTQTHLIDDSGDRANVQQVVCQNTGGRKLSSAFCNSIVLHIGLDIIYLAFYCYLHHQFFNHHRFRADGILIPVLRQALFVSSNTTTKPSQYSKWRTLQSITEYKCR